MKSVGKCDSHWKNSTSIKIMNLGNFNNITGKASKTSQGINLSITCQVCGEPIEHTDRYGMFCKNKCGYDEAKKAYKLYDKMAKKLAEEWEEEDKEFE